MLGLNHRITELEELVPRCLKTGAIRVDDHRDLWDDIHARLKLHQGESKPEPMTTYQKLTEAQGRIKELEAENTQLRRDLSANVVSLNEAGKFNSAMADERAQSRATIAVAKDLLRDCMTLLRNIYAGSTQFIELIRRYDDLLSNSNEYVKRMREGIPTMDKPKQSASEQTQTQATGTAQQCFEESQEWAKRCAHSEDELTKSRATIAALEARLESGVSALRQSEQLLNYLNSKGGLGLDVHDTIRRILADILASTALKTKVGES